MILDSDSSVLNHTPRTTQQTDNLLLVYLCRGGPLTFISAAGRNTQAAESVSGASPDAKKTSFKKPRG